MAAEPEVITYLPTSLDKLHAMMYANDVVRRQKCLDKTIQKDLGG